MGSIVSAVTGAYALAVLSSAVGGHWPMYSHILKGTTSAALPRDAPSEAAGGSSRGSTIHLPIDGPVD